MAPSSSSSSGGNGAPPSPATSSMGARFLKDLASTARTVKYEHLVAGVSGGVVSTLVLHPLDLLKIRFAVDDGKEDPSRPRYTGLRNAFGSVVRDEGFRGLYKGVTPNVAGAGMSWGLYFLFYHTIKTEMQEGNSRVRLSPAMHMTAAAEAGVLTLAMTNPIWVVKTRLCLQYEDKRPRGALPSSPSAAAAIDSKTTYRGMVDALYKISKYEGLRGLYRGFVPGLWGVSHGAIQFMVYEELKTDYNKFKKQPIDAKLGTLEYLGFAALSKLVAAVTTYPYQVVRARLQDQHKSGSYSGAVDCVRQTLRHEGLKGFYKGLLPNLVRVVPATAITFVVYEETTHFLLRDVGNGEE